MLPQRPRALDPDFATNVSHDEAAEAARPAEHHCQVCPTCSHQLTGHRCKLVCTQCGYYLSCADYY
jgi:ribosomal protein L32